MKATCTRCERSWEDDSDTLSCFWCGCRKWTLEDGEDSGMLDLEQFLEDMGWDDEPTKS